MAKITLDPKKMLGFRLLDAAEASEEHAVLSAKSGKVEPQIGDQMAISAKFGKPGKEPGRPFGVTRA